MLWRKNNGIYSNAKSGTANVNLTKFSGFIFYGILAIYYIRKWGAIHKMQNSEGNDI
jgi:hypothetical protein